MRSSTAGSSRSASPNGSAATASGLPEVATALTEIGRHGTVSPALATLGFGLLPLLDLASDEQQDRFLAGVAKGSVLTAALNEPGAPLPERPSTSRSAGGPGSTAPRSRFPMRSKRIGSS